MASKHTSLADIPAAWAQYTGVWYVLRLSILAPDGNTRLPMNVLPKNGSYRPITAGKGPSVPEGARRGMLLQMLSTLCSNAARPAETDERQLHVLVSGPLQARGGAGRAAHAVALVHGTGSRLRGRAHRRAILEATVSTSRRAE